MENLNGIKKSESIAQLALSLAKVNKTLKNIPKEIEGAKGKNDVKARYKYFDIAQLLDHVRVPLAEVGISVLQFNINGKTADEVGCVTMLLHESGEYIESPPTYAKIDNPVNNYGNKNMNDIQAYGSVLSYVRRYSLSSVLGLAGSEDNDGERIDTNVNQYNNNYNKNTNYQNNTNYQKNTNYNQQNGYQNKNNNGYNNQQGNYQQNNYQQNNNTQNQNGTTLNMISSKQSEFLGKLLRDNGYVDDASIGGFFNSVIGINKNMNELTKVEATKVIDALKPKQQVQMQ